MALVHLDKQPLYEKLNGLVMAFLGVAPRQAVPTAIVAVPDRNGILVHRVFRAHQRVQHATALSFRYMDVSDIHAFT